MQDSKRLMRWCLIAAALLFASGGGLAGRILAQAPQDQASVQAVKNYVDAIKGLQYEPEVKDESLANLAKVTTEDFVLLAPGLGPAPYVGQEAVYQARKENMEKTDSVGFRMELVDVFFASGPYVIATRNDRRIGKDGQEHNAGDNILGAYVIKNGKVQLNYNFGGGAAQGQEAQNQANIQAVKDFMETVKDSSLESLSKFTTADLVVWTPGLGPAPFVGREAVYRARKESMEKNGAVGFRSELLEVLFAKGPYVITRRNDYRVFQDGTERSAGSNIMGLYVIDKDGKVIFWYNPGGAGAAPR